MITESSATQRSRGRTPLVKVESTDGELSFPLQDARQNMDSPDSLPQDSPPKTSLPGAVLRGECPSPPQSRRGSDLADLRRTPSRTRVMNNDKIPRSNSHSKLITFAAMNSANKSLKVLPKSLAQLPSLQRSHSNNVIAMLHHGIDSVEGSDDEDALHSSTPPGTPGIPIPSLPVRRDSIKARSMLNVAEMAVACAAGAAEVIGQPTVSQARARSFLLGSCGPTSILGADELDRYFPNRSLRIFIGTWNMNEQNPPRYLSDFLLPQDIEFVPDMLVISSQESYHDRTEWEVRLQDTLGPSHVLYHSAHLGCLHTAIFMRRDLIWFCSLPDVDSFSTLPGVAGNFKTKGAIAIGLMVFGTSFLFVNCHLTAHQENTRDRVKDLKKIKAVINLPKILPFPSKLKHFSKKRDFTDNFDITFWCGDLNFRLEQTREVVVRELLNHADKSYKHVLDFDQLNYLKDQGHILKGFNEEPIHFPPTFKYDVGTSNFDSSYKQRVPSYTDRILYKARKAAVKNLHYDSVHEVVTSDHKPVWGMWEVSIKPGRDDCIPMSGGLFNRDVYLEGLKRRAEALQPFGDLGSGKQNAKCVIS